MCAHGAGGSSQGGSTASGSTSSAAASSSSGWPASRSSGTQGSRGSGRGPGALDPIPSSPGPDPEEPPPPAPAAPHAAASGAGASSENCSGGGSAGPGPEPAAGAADAPAAAAAASAPGGRPDDGTAAAGAPSVAGGSAQQGGAAPPASLDPAPGPPPPPPLPRQQAEPPRGAPLQEAPAAAPAPAPVLAAVGPSPGRLQQVLDAGEHASAAQQDAGGREVPGTANGPSGSGAAEAALESEYERRAPSDWLPAATANGQAGPGADAHAHELAASQPGAQQPGGQPCGEREGELELGEQADGRPDWLGCPAMNVPALRLAGGGGRELRDCAASGSGGSRTSGGSTSTHDSCAPAPYDLLCTWPPAPGGPAAGATHLAGAGVLGKGGYADLHFSSLPGSPHGARGGGGGSVGGGRGPSTPLGRSNAPSAPPGGWGGRPWSAGPVGGLGLGLGSPVGPRPLGPGASLSPGVYTLTRGGSERGHISGRHSAPFAVDMAPSAAALLTRLFDAAPGAGRPGGGDAVPASAFGGPPPPPPRPSPGGAGSRLARYGSGPAAVGGAHGAGASDLGRPPFATLCEADMDADSYMLLGSALGAELGFVTGPAASPPAKPAPPAWERGADGAAPSSGLGSAQGGGVLGGGGGGGGTGAFGAQSPRSPPLCRAGLLDGCANGIAAYPAGLLSPLPGAEAGGLGAGAGAAPAACFPQRPGAPVCDYYQKVGTCRYREACKFDHPPRFAVALNRAGLPMRPGEAPCSFYERTGACKFAASCKFDHKDYPPDHAFPDAARSAAAPPPPREPPPPPRMRRERRSP